jgi:hypothetical protein
MRLKPLGNNQNELRLHNNTRILFSFETPVAAWTQAHGYMRTNVVYSRTTTRHITTWLAGDHPTHVTVVEQAVLHALIA